MEPHDILFLELLINNSKKRCSKNNITRDAVKDDNSGNMIRNGFDYIVESIQVDIQNNELILSNFDTFIKRLYIVIKTYIKTFEKEYNGKQD